MLNYYIILLIDALFVQPAVVVWHDQPLGAVRWVLEEGVIAGFIS